MFISLFFIITGSVFLLKNLGIITTDVWGIIWPLVLISFGIYLFLKARRYRLFWDRVWQRFER